MQLSLEKSPSRFLASLILMVSSDFSHEPNLGSIHADFILEMEKNYLVYEK